MLYITTRSKHDVYTAPVTLHQDRGSDGGLFIPFRMPTYEKEQLMDMASRSMSQNVADVLNQFFGTKLTGWDVDMSMGRYLLKVRNMNFRVLIAEVWHNMDQNFGKCIRSLAERIHPDGDIIGKHSDWTEIAIRISVLFGIYCELLRTQQVEIHKPINIAVSSGSFSAPMAAWYARQMGLPIDTIICGCNENGAVWELLHRGELDTGVIAVDTSTPEGDWAVPPDLERLICGACGQEETMNYCFSCMEGTTYVPSPETHRAIRQGMFAAVVSQVRVDTIIPSVYRTNRYVLDMYAALAYGALSDYRSRTGKSTTTLLLCENSPLCQAQTIAESMNISVSELKKRVAEV